MAENKAAARQCGKRRFAQRFALRAVDGDRAGGLKGQAGDRSDIGKSPVFITERGEAQFRKGGNGGAAQGREPLRLCARHGLPEGFNNP